VALLILEGRTDKEMQRRTEFFLDVLQILDSMHDVCGMIDIMAGLHNFHVKRLKDKIWVSIDVIIEFFTTEESRVL